MPSKLDRMFIALGIWTICVFMDYLLNRLAGRMIGLDKPPWNLKKAMVFFGISTVLAMWLMGLP